METWKPVTGWETFYEVSDLGNVKSIKRQGKTNFGERNYGGSLINSFKSSSGYLAVNLTCPGNRKQFHVHRLVLEAFIGMPPKKHEACHNNGKRNDNKLTNLRWDTRKNNHADKKLHGTWQGGENSGTAKLTNEAVLFIKKSDIPRSKLAKIFNVGKSTIEKVQNNRSWTHVK
jgi:hypothetical protein